MSTLPAGWRTTRLDETADIRLGRQRSPATHRGERMRSYLRAANVDWNTLRLDEVKEMVFTEAEDKQYRLETGDILVVEASGSVSEVGKSVVYRGTPDDVRFQNTLLRVRCHMADPDFIQLQLYSMALAGQFSRGARGVGINHLSRAGLARQSVVLPPMDEQRRIVAILEDHLAHLDTAKAYLGAAREMAGQWLAIALAAAGEGNMRRLEDVADIQGGIQKQPKRAPVRNTCPFLRVANVTADGLDLRQVHSIEIFDGDIVRFGLSKGDLLVVEGNGSPSQIGRAAVWDGSIEPCVHQNHLIRVRARHGLSPAYLEIVWNSPRNREILTAVSSSSSGLHTLSVSKLSKMMIPVPDSTRQSAIVDEVTQVRVCMTRLATRVRELEASAVVLRRSLLAAAFRGDLTRDFRTDD